MSTETPVQVTEPVAPSTAAQIAPVADPVVTGSDGKPFDPARAQELIEKLRAENKTAKAAEKELAELKADAQKRADAELSETERLKKQATEAQAENAKLKSDILRRDVISETGLPAIFADRLKGDTKEALLADALELAKTLPTIKQAPHINTTNPNQANPNETEASKRERLFGRQGNVFDMDAIKAGGGGVVWNK